MKFRLWLLLVIGIMVSSRTFGAKLFIPMDATQKNHLKAYGITYAAIDGGTRVGWLLNYKGGSFVMEYTSLLDTLCKRKGVSFTRMTDKEYLAIAKKIKAPAFNGDVIALEKVPKIAVYTPSGKKPWDDAVTLALTYAEIPFDKLYVDSVLGGALKRYDWLHLHHEDFTGQYGKFWALFNEIDWYKADVNRTKKMAYQNGFDKVSQMQLAVAKKIREFVAAGGNLFAMCTATDSYDIALAANGIDICDTPYDGDAIDRHALSKLDYDNCFAFTGFTLSTDKYEYRLSSIDNSKAHSPDNDPETDYFTLLPFPAKFDPVPTMLCQNHTRKIKGFLGLTTAYSNAVLKPDVVVMGDYKELNDAKYIHGRYMAGTWTFYGGHDPEDYRHTVGAAPTDLSNYPNSPGYRLILNNVLCPASGKKDVAPVICCDSMATTPRKSGGTATPSVAKSNVKITAGTTANTLIISIAGAAENTAPIRKIERVTFVNTDGKELFDKQYSSLKVTIEMGGLPDGMYNIKVNGEYAGKVVKN